MSTPVSSAPFHALVSALQASGCEAQAALLQSVLDGCWTTSTEMIGELGSAVLLIRRQCRPLTAEQKTLLRQCLREVRKVWPGFGLLDSLLLWF